MKANSILNKALGQLSHPISLTALGVYAITIFVLQNLSPNWLTGKLGDFAWMFLAPLALTALLAWVLPKRYNEHAFPFAVISTVLVFVLMKATPFNAGIVSGLEKLTGYPVSVVRDASDLLALTVVPVTIWFWYRPQFKIRTTYPAGVIVMAVLALLTLADSAAPKLGITSIEFGDGIITACGGYYGNFQSSDGGQIWQPSDVKCQEMVTSPKYGEAVQDPTDGNIQYRFKSGFIERSADGGKNWQADYQWTIHSEAERLYYITSKKSWSISMQTPFSAAVQPETGDIFFAMGYEGILKRTKGTQPNYTWITVGEYQKVNYRKSELLFNMLYGEWMLAVAAGGVGVTMLDIKSHPGKFKKALLILCMIGMTGCALIFPPAPTLAGPYFGSFVQMGLFILLLLMLSLTVNGLVNAGIRSKRLLRVYIIGFLVITILTFAPYSLWIYNIIPLYKNSTFAAIALAILSIVGFQFITRKWMSINMPQS